MLRSLYIFLVRLHPSSFRERFGEEMAVAFDESTGGWARAVLLLDGFMSVVRQWLKRPAPQRPAVSTVGIGPSPMFHMIESSPPRLSAMAEGIVLSLVMFAAVTLAMGRGGFLPRALIGARYPRPHVLSVSRSSIAEADPTTEVKVVAPAADPLYEIAAVYFKIVRVLNALDADKDLIISPWEIITAPAALAKLDFDGDGSLSPEECGLVMSEALKQKLGPRLVGTVRLEFMRLNPVLAALDADHDGEISPEEIKNSSAALKTLDKNHDGSLTPAELIPDPVESRAAIILSRLDTNGDGVISRQELEAESDGPFRRLLDQADRNGDGMITSDELKQELRLRFEAKKQMDRAIVATQPTK